MRGDISVQVRHARSPTTLSEVFVAELSGRHVQCKLRTGVQSQAGHSATCAERRQALERQSAVTQTGRGGGGGRRPCVDVTAGCRIDAGQCDPDDRDEWRKAWIGQVRSRGRLGNERMRALVTGLQTRRLRRARILVMTRHGSEVPGSDADGKFRRRDGDVFVDPRMVVGSGVLQRASVAHAGRECKQPHQQHRHRGAAPGSVVWEGSHK